MTLTGIDCGLGKALQQEPDARGMVPPTGKNSLLTRRSFAALLTSTIAGAGLAWGKRPATSRKTVLYSGVGPTFTCYEVDVSAATLVKRGSVELPSNVQYAWPHPSRKFLYVSSSNGGPGQAGERHFVTAFRVDGSTGALHVHGEPVALRSRPIHNSVDVAGEYLFVAYNDPSGLSVHRIEADGMIGAQVRQPENLDCGVYAHQIRATPSNQSVILVTRGNDATITRPEDPGSLKVYGFKNGMLTNKAAVQPGNGLGFGPRHLDFHPTRPWIYVSIERQNKLYVYELQPDGGLSPTPLFVKDTMSDASTRISMAGPIHIHPNGRFVYMTNRGKWANPVEPPGNVYQGQRVYQSTDSNLTVFSIDQYTGEPTLIQTIDSQGVHPRTFSIDASGRILVAGSLSPIALRERGEIRVLPAGLSIFRIGQDGRLRYMRRYDLGTGDKTQFWSGLVELA
jgi:6-phosphogluconolactonase